jgi:aquaporin Z
MYAIEGAALGVFLLVAIVVTWAIEDLGSPLRPMLGSPLLRRAIIGAAMGLTAAAIIYSPWGMKSGAHLNPAVTLSFFRLRKIKTPDAVFYVVAQFVGAAVAIGLAALLLPATASAVAYVATVPGPQGAWAAFAGEAVISFVMMAAILVLSNSMRTAPFTGAFAGVLIAVYIIIEAPLSGMSMNPARSLAPAVAAGTMSSMWIYFVAPTLGMFMAAELYVRLCGWRAVHCAKLHHPSTGPCHFNCTPP